jgi:hypothetical protein
MDTTSTTNHDNTINFMYFLTNHPYNFIQKIWSPLLAQHFQSKFESYCKKHPTTRNAIVDLFYEMDRDNQRIFLKWINENYNAFSDLKL